MQNHFASNSRYFMAYWLTWVIMAIIYAVILITLAQLTYLAALLDAFIFGLLFSVMGLAVWYVTRFSGLESPQVLNTIGTHLVAAGLLVFAMVSLGETILGYFDLHNSGFYKFDSDQHIYRLLVGGIIYLFLVINFYMINYYEEFRSRKIRQVEMDKSLKSAELNMLKAQINPHFIFNSLNSVSSLTLTEPEKAQKMVIQLSDFLRYSIRKNADQLVSLKQEIEAINLFLAIEKIRYGDRLGVSVSCDDKTQELKLPVLILQPLVENAIKYSLYETDEESKIEIRCSADENKQLLVSITNSFDKEAVVTKGEGIGLDNVRSRMNLVYNQMDLLSIDKKDNLFKVILTVPQDEED